MNPRLLVPRQTTHPEALAWRAAAIANGGSVSGTEFNAVNAMFRSLDSTGLRSKFWRLNLLIGGFNGALVPQIRGPSRTGTQYGNATDTGVNLVSGDWSLATGMTGNGSNKYMRPGTMSAIKPSWTTGHFGFWATDVYDASDRTHMGAWFNEGRTSPRGWYQTVGKSTTVRQGEFGYAGGGTIPSFTTTNNWKVVDRASSTNLRLIENGSQVGSTLATADTATVLPGGDFCIMATSYQNVSGGTPTSVVNGYSPCVGTFRGYSIGETASLAQYTALTTLFATFFTAIGRPAG